MKLYRREKESRTGSRKISLALVLIVLPLLVIGVLMRRRAARRSSDEFGLEDLKSQLTDLESEIDRMIESM